MRPTFALAMLGAMRWHLFCKVIDNFGDIGVAWRLATQLSDAGHEVQLWVDQDQALQWMATPQQRERIVVHPWRDDQAPTQAPTSSSWSSLPSPDVVVETFGCGLPQTVIAQLQMLPPDQQAVWVNLEYLSAQDHVERNHGLRSPQASGLDCWFFYPGFTAKTGGLLKGGDDAHANAQAAGFIDTMFDKNGPDETHISLFCYPHAPLLEWAKAWLQDPKVALYLTPGASKMLADAAVNTHQTPARVRHLPWLTQIQYERVLAHCDLNFVRGEDSFVRAQWAGQPFVWHIYPQHDGVHEDKLQAFLARFHAQQNTPPLPQITQLHRAWNALPTTNTFALDWPQLKALLPAWQVQTQAWLKHLHTLSEQQGDLVTQLTSFVQAKKQLK